MSRLDVESATRRRAGIERSALFAWVFVIGCVPRPAVMVSSSLGPSGSSALGTQAQAAALRDCDPALVKKRDALVRAGGAVVSLAVVDLLDKLPSQSPSSLPSGAGAGAGAGAGTSAGLPLGDQALFGDVLTVLPAKLEAAACGFVEVRTDSGYPGFASVAGLLPWSLRTAPYRSGPRLRVVSRFANVFAQPDVTKENPLVSLPLGVELRFVQRLALPGESDRWREIELPSGAHAYVHKGDVVEVGSMGSSFALSAQPSVPGPAQSMAVDAGSLPACVIAQGLAHEGTPYLWGGRSTYGIDCSGLVANAFRACGVVSPRDAGPQADWSAVQPVPLSVDSLAPGDLVFFGKPKPVEPGAKDAKPKITHVGIYVGKGRFVHATTTEHPTVHVSDLRDPHWTGIWVGARRYAGTTPK